MASISRRDIALAIVSLSKKQSQKQLSEAVAAYLVANRRTSELDAIMREVSRLREQQDGVTEMTATSAYKLDAAAQKAIVALFPNQTLIINEVVDSDVLGGVRLETSEMQLDLTVRNRLQRLKAATN